MSDRLKERTLFGQDMESRMNYFWDEEADIAYYLKKYEEGGEDADVYYGIHELLNIYAQTGNTVIAWMIWDMIRGYQCDFELSCGAKEQPLFPFFPMPIEVLNYFDECAFALRKEIEKNCSESERSASKIPRIFKLNAIGQGDFIARARKIFQQLRAIRMFRRTIAEGDLSRNEAIEEVSRQLSQEQKVEISFEQVERWIKNNKVRGLIKD